MTEVMTQTPSATQGPTDKEKKYDRQLRLWAATGQAALESANILLVNSGPGTVGVETLKNLVLPGVGKFTIADDTIVGDADLGVNFFLDESRRGKSRAQCCTELLLELNPEVTGDWCPKAEGSLKLEDVLAATSPFTAILYTLPLKPDQLRLIEDYGCQHNVPLIAVHSVGFYSYFHISLPGAFPIVDTHPEETATTDLRLLTPWNELSEFADLMTKDIDKLNDHDHGHLPLVVVLLHFLDEWKVGHGGALPTSYADKTAFRATVSQAMRRDNAEGGEENFEEAVSAVMKHITPSAIPSSLQEVFDYKHEEQVQGKRTFWIIAEGVKEFYAKNQRLPVAGGLPDMKSESQVYIKLQNIYKEKSRQDSKEVLSSVRNIAGGVDIDPAEVELFCTNARFIKLVNAEGRKGLEMEQIVAKELANDEIAAVAGPEMPLSLLPIYLALTATSHASTATPEEILASMTERAPLLAGNERAQQAAQEVSRAAGGELHNISAVMGGMVAQEMIKIITEQYIPIDNTCIFDGIESRCQVLRL